LILRLCNIEVFYNCNLRSWIKPDFGQIKLPKTGDRNGNQNRKADSNWNSSRHTKPAERNQAQVLRITNKKGAPHVWHRCKDPQKVAARCATDTGNENPRPSPNPDPNTSTTKRGSTECTRKRTWAQMNDDDVATTAAGKSSSSSNLFRTVLNSVK